MSSHLVAVCFEAGDPDAAGAFWAGILGRQSIPEPAGVFVPGSDSQVGLRFVSGSTPRPMRNRLHLHVTSVDVDDQRRIVEAALRLGGRRRGTRPLPIGHAIYLFDPDGNELCVIEPTNSYLAGCGPLGEVTCDGTRTAALFWQAALDWSIVWDEGDQIAIQSPAGGTKVAWDAWPESTTVGWNRQRFDLTSPSPETEVERLLSLGATRRVDHEGVVRLIDPDGSEFSINGPTATVKP